MAALNAAALALALAAPAAAAPGGAPAAALAPATVEVQRAQGPLPVDPAAAAWQAAPSRVVPLAPQRTLRLADRAANAALAAAAPRAVTVRALTDGAALAVQLEWRDATEDRARPDATDAYGDGVALQLPLRAGAGVRLPYVGMGDEEERVALLLVRAVEGGATVREATAAGFGTLARAELGGTQARMAHDPARGLWRAVIVRPLAAGGLDLRRALVPFAVATWDGARHERGGNKALSGWRLLALPGVAPEPAHAEELARALAAAPGADVARGKQLVDGLCAGCHHTPDRRAARPGLAPDLAAIGPIATPAYLHESLVAPSAVIVPGPNPAQHQDRSRAPDARGAYPDHEAFTWWRRDAGGKRVSRMPAYAALPPRDLDAIVAYLGTLGAPPPQEEQP